MAPRIRRRRARIAIFAVSLRQKDRCQDLQRRDQAPKRRSGSLESREQRSEPQQFAAESVRHGFEPWKWNGNWKWKCWSNSALFLIRGHHGRFYLSCRTSPGTTIFAGARDHRATCPGSYLHPQHPQERTHWIRNRRNGNGEWAELAIRQRYPLDRADYRGPAD